MALSSALFASVAGLDTTSTAISVIGDNISNVNTPGFKQKRAEFTEVLGQSISGVTGNSTLGQGARLSQISTVFTQGALETTAKPEDLAINGKGFFVMEGAEGTYYTRNGVFDFSKEGTFVDPSGLRVQGFAIDPATGQPTGERGDIVRSTALAPPQATSSYSVAANFNPDDDALIFDPANPTGTSSFVSSATLYDSLGNPRTSTTYFTRTGVGTWDWNATLPAAETTLPPVGGADAVVQGGGTLTFDSSGTLTSATGTSVTYEYAGGSAPSLTVDFDFGPIGGVGTGSASTSYGDVDSSVSSFSQNGFSAGTLSSINISLDGVLTGQFSNGETIPLAQIALATFPNIAGLQAVGGSRLIETRNSGQPLIGEPDSGSFGSVRSGSLEQSTVDLAAEFVKLIINQRAFQANTRTVSVANELLGNLVSLGQ